MAATLNFTSFFTIAFLGAALFFTCFGLDITSFCIASHKASHKLALVFPFNFFFLYCRNCGTKEAIVCIAFCLIKYSGTLIIQTNWVEREFI